MLRWILLIGGVISLSPPVLALGLWLYSIVFNFLQSRHFQRSGAAIGVTIDSMHVEFNWLAMLPFLVVGVCLIVLGLKLKNRKPDS